MSDEDAMLFESSIASFMTSAASQIDTLRRSIQEGSSNRSEDVMAHRSGIVSHLVSALDQLMKDFQKMQKRRNRIELELYLDPLKCVCCYYDQDTGMDDDNMKAFADDSMVKDDLDLELDEEYLDTLEKDEEEFQILLRLQSKDDVLNRILEEPLPSIPVFVPPSEKISEEVIDVKVSHSASVEKNEHVGKTQRHPRREGAVGTQVPAWGQGESHLQQDDILQQEQIFLNTAVQNTDLDAAQNIESQMMQITSLLSQFSSLINEQQEEIQIITESTVQSRMNVNKGTEKIVQATEQRKKSRHYFAWIIVTMGLLLLFLNAIIA
jgi:hypothetical protein